MNRLTRDYNPFVTEMEYTLKDKIKSNRKYAPQVFWKHKYSLERQYEKLKQLEDIEEEFDVNLIAFIKVYIELINHPRVYFKKGNRIEEVSYFKYYITVDLTDKCFVCIDYEMEDILHFSDYKKNVGT